MNVWLILPKSLNSVICSSSSICNPTGWPNSFVIVFPKDALCCISDSLKSFKFEPERWKNIFALWYELPSMSFLVALLPLALNDNVYVTSFLTVKLYVLSKSTLPTWLYVS